MIWLALLTAAAILAAVLWLALGAEPECPSAWELDGQACDQMRESGWDEEEIEAFMARYGGWYHPPTETPGVRSKKAA